MTVLFARMAAVALGLLVLAPVISPAQAPVTSVSALGNARVSPLPTGVVVVSMEASGDLPGLLTLTLHVNGRAVTGGEWALVISSRQPGAFSGAPAVHGVDVPDLAGPSDQVGALSGVVKAGGKLRVASNGTIVGLSGITLRIRQVTPPSPGVVGGHGRADATSLNSYVRSHGHLTLTF